LYTGVGPINTCEPFSTKAAVVLHCRPQVHPAMRRSSQTATAFKRRYPAASPASYSAKAEASNQRRSTKEKIMARWQCCKMTKRTGKSANQKQIADKSRVFWVKIMQNAILN
jgi:hypothetical protein